MFGIWLLRGAVVVLVLGAGVGARVAYEKVTVAGPHFATAQAQESNDLYDFDTQEEAQAVYDQDTSDPYGLWTRTTRDPTTA
ncbi:hypothetical protein GBA63_04870 [Rubrobacter tropicus]|uniref:Uncharacterized protein n=1 Tax=Rubrobacter tropicus TaxID=2653851 RepID=A0A6G8Q6U9_9ACTN|nr:hypothetical protein [Rubrobacter tropicus]QIN82047.1 hypothetical protein GBA63_04870 [Rubrobacter tropicus]